MSDIKSNTFVGITANTNWFDEPGKRRILAKETG